MSNAHNSGSDLARGIRADIIRGEFAPGTKLKVQELAERYSVSAIPVREALSRLATSGFVTFQHQRGFRVADASMDELQDITETRIFVECEALRQSIQQAGLEWEGLVLSAHHYLSRLHLMSAAGTGIDQRWAEAHGAFHSALLAGCKSKWLMWMASTLREHSERYRNLSVLAEQVDVPRDVASEHDALCKAALSRDAELACAHLAAHLRRTAKLAISAATSQPGKGDAA